MQNIDGIRAALAELLKAEGFKAMAREVRTEQEIGRLRQYARVVVKNAPTQCRADITRGLAALDLLPGVQS